MTESSSDFFDSSLEAIRNTLSDADRMSFRRFATPKEMIAEIRLIMRKHENKSRLAACCRRIDAFSKAFEPYFDVIGIFVQVKPEWAAWFWGMIRVVFLLGSNLVRFFESVTQMFERITFTLPQYQAWFNICKRGVKAEDNDRLANSLSLIYADVIEFCLHVYRIFSRIRRGSNFIRRTAIMGDLLWKPFQSRFSDLLERLHKHQIWFETETMIQQHDAITQHHATFLDYLKQTEQKTVVARRKEIQEKEKETAKQVSQIRTWLASPRYRDVYERAKRDIHPGSGESFLQETRYLAWRNAVFGKKRPGNLALPKEDWLERTLFVQAKPGFGKTYLSCIVIDDLLENPDISAPDDQNTPMVAFFHFSSTDRWSSRSPIEALKSIASQLVNSHRDNQLTIDALGILMNDIGSGQHEASMDDLLALLGILLRQHPTFLVIDGVDECDDPITFLCTLKDLCHANDCRVFLLGRPTITFPPSLTSLNAEKVENSSVFELSKSLNLPDIKRFLETHLACMANSALFGLEERINVKKAAVGLASHANGIFLWARLLVNYLYCDAVTPLDRLSVLVNPSQFEGLEQLYDRILETLRKSNEREQAVAGILFQWISFSLFPLGIRALHTALAIIPGKPTSKLQYLTGFPGCIPRITCALVEVDGDDLAFIHLSFKEYLDSKDGAFSLKDKSSANMQLARKCLSFLTYDVPAKPLESLEPPARYMCSVGEEASASHLEANTAQEAQMARFDTVGKLHREYPLLRYAALCWYRHIHQAHAFDSAQVSELCSEPQDQGRMKASEMLDSWIPILARFLVRRNTVTMWVEACCIFRLLPRLKNFALALDYLVDVGSPNTARDREIWWVSNGLQQLAGALESLRERHSAELWTNPSLIWQREITTAIDRSFWPVWEEDEKEIRATAHRFEIDADSGFLPNYGSFPQPLSSQGDITYPPLYTRSPERGGRFWLRINHYFHWA